MEMEEIIKGVITVLIVGISLMSRISRNKRQRKTQTANDTPTSQPSQKTPKRDIFSELIESIDRRLDELADEGKSQEDIFDEIAENREMVSHSQNKPLQQEVKSDTVTKKATNRTFEKNIEKNESYGKSSSLSRKFNLREAVIYSEILTPKFKQEEME